MVAAVIAYVAADHNPDDLPVFVFVTVGIFWIFWVKTFIVVQIDRTAFDDDVTATVAHDFLLWGYEVYLFEARGLLPTKSERLAGRDRTTQFNQPSPFKTRSADPYVLFSRR